MLLGVPPCMPSEQQVHHITTVKWHGAPVAQQLAMFEKSLTLDVAQQPVWHIYYILSHEVYWGFLSLKSGSILHARQ